jgi:hypothetical protein
LIGDATSLPFRPGSFDEVVFSEVLEHLPHGTEGVALDEILRILSPGGNLFLTTPAAHPLYKVLDLAWYAGHRHYGLDELIRLVTRHGFVVEIAFRGGGPRDCLLNLLHQTLIYPGLLPKALQGRIVHRLSRVRNPITEVDSRKGYTVFVLARKEGRSTVVAREQDLERASSGMTAVLDFGRRVAATGGLAAILGIAVFKSVPLESLAGIAATAAFASLAIAFLLGIGATRSRTFST